MFHHLSESPESVRGALTSLLIPHFKHGKIEILRGTGETFMGLINLPPEIQSMVRQPLHCYLTTILRFIVSNQSPDKIMANVECVIFHISKSIYKNKKKLTTIIFDAYLAVSNFMFVCFFLLRLSFFFFFLLSFFLSFFISFSLSFSCFSFFRIMHSLFFNILCALDLIIYSDMYTQSSTPIITVGPLIFLSNKTKEIL